MSIGPMPIAHREEMTMWKAQDMWIRQICVLVLLVGIICGNTSLRRKRKLCYYIGYLFFGGLIWVHSVLNSLEALDIWLGWWRLAFGCLIAGRLRPLLLYRNDACLWIIIFRLYNDLLRWLLLGTAWLLPILLVKVWRTRRRFVLRGASMVLHLWVLRSLQCCSGRPCRLIKPIWNVDHFHFLAWLLLQMWMRRRLNGVRLHTLCWVRCLILISSLFPQWKSFWAAVVVIGGPHLRLWHGLSTVRPIAFKKLVLRRVLIFSSQQLSGRMTISICFNSLATRAALLIVAWVARQCLNSCCILSIVR